MIIKQFTKWLKRTWNAEGAIEKWTKKYTEENIDEWISTLGPKGTIDMLEDDIHRNNNNAKLVAYLYEKQSQIYANYLKDYSAALKACDRGLNALSGEEWSSEETLLYYYKYVAEEKLGMTWRARRDSLIVYQHANGETLLTGDNKTISLEDAALGAFNILDNDWADKYLGVDYKDRKALLVVPSISDAGTTHIDVFRISNLPENISFPIGHPVVNQLYIGHPYKPETYLPSDSCQYTLVEERVREFCRLSQALGATEITVEAINDSKTSQGGSIDNSISGGYSYSNPEVPDPKHSARVSFHNKGNYHSAEGRYQALNFHQIYIPQGPVHLPEKMVWYPYEKSWQDLYQQRLNGILYHEERIETRKSQVLSQSELAEIKGEVENVIKINGGWEGSVDEMFSQEDSAVLSIKVTFAPLSQ